MRSRRIAAAAAVLALLLAACGSDASSDNTTTPEPAPEQTTTQAPPPDETPNTAPAPDFIVVDNDEPQNPLIPAITHDASGGLVLQNLFAMPVYFRADGRMAMDAAESITSDDNELWTITLEAGRVFSDGSSVTAQSFVDAWQYAASDPSFGNDAWFDGWEGYQSDEVVENSLSLEVIDDTTFTVLLSAPNASFPLTLGATVFAPLPESFFDDPAAFGRNPVGNGPYTFGQWNPGANLTVSANRFYSGPRAAQNAGIDFVVHPSLDSAYAALLSDATDIIRQVPPAAIGSFETDLADRAINQPGAAWQGLTIPQDLPHFEGAEGLLRRQAVSLAINREQIAKTIFQNTGQPAVEYTSPVIAGFDGNIAGSDVVKWTEGNVAQAQDLWAQADEISAWEGSFQIAYNTDGQDEPWVTAVSMELGNVLGIQAEGLPYPDLDSMRADLSSGAVIAASSSHWQLGWPGADNILASQYVTGAEYNVGGYTNRDFDDVIEQARQAPSIAEANALYEQAQEILFADLPVLPLWYQGIQAGYSTNVGNVEFGWDSWPILFQVTKG